MGTIENFKVPGATLHVEVSGSGPTLLMIPGAPADYSVLSGVGAILAERYTVVTFDLRGMSRSPLDGGPVDVGPEDFADDAAEVLDKYGSGPAYVLGSSGGAVAGLDLVARYPGRVRTLVAHEPPVAGVLPNGVEWIEFFDQVHDLGETAGSGAAMGLFIASFGNYAGPEADPSKGEPPQFPMPDFASMSPAEAEVFQRMGQNSDFFVAHLIQHTPRYTVDVAALKASDTKVVIAVGEDSAGQVPHRAGRAVAESLGVDPVIFPGDHTGFGTHTEEWAAAVAKALDA
jgi:pimeloyl-ACP methyl ester carboxylesterase